MRAYFSSKTANVLFANVLSPVIAYFAEAFIDLIEFIQELFRRYGSRGLTANAVHPVC